MAREAKSFARGVILQLAVAMLLIAAIASAGEWKTSGGGSAAAKADRAKTLVATPGTPATLLIPGGTADVALTISNPNGWDTTVRSITGNGTVTSDTAGCPGSVTTFADQAGSWLVPKKSGSTDGRLDIMLTGAATMAADAPDECQGQRSPSR